MQYTTTTTTTMVMVMVMVIIAGTLEMSIAIHVTLPTSTHTIHLIRHPVRMVEARCLTKSIYAIIFSGFKAHRLPPCAVCRVPCAVLVVWCGVVWCVVCGVEW
jgi:hypothetical protein